MYRTPGKEEMIFSIAVGVLLGFSGLAVSWALLVLAVCIPVKVFVDVKWDRVPITGRVSPYVVYCYNLSQAGERVEFAWISYGVQLFVFGMLLGGAAFALVRYLVAPVGG